MHVMTKEAAEKYRAEYRKAITPATGTMKLWKSEAERQRHLREVEIAQKEYKTPF